MLPGYDKHGRRVFVQRLSIADPSVYKPSEVLKASLMVGDITIHNATFQTEVRFLIGTFANDDVFPTVLYKNYYVQVCGAVVISDMVGLSLGHVKNYTPAWAKKISTIFQASGTQMTLYRRGLSFLFTAVHAGISA